MSKQWSSCAFFRNCLSLSGVAIRLLNESARVIDVQRGWLPQCFITSKLRLNFMVCSKQNSFVTQKSRESTFMHFEDKNCFLKLDSPKTQLSLMFCGENLHQQISQFLAGFRSLVVRHHFTRWRCCSLSVNGFFPSLNGIMLSLPKYNKAAFLSAPFFV